MSATIRVEIASPPDRERLVACLMVGNEQWAELSQEDETLELELYPRRDGQPWKISYEDAVAALIEAKSRLVGGSTT